MGLGGYLTWTAAGREIFQHTGIKLLPVENVQNGFIKIIKNEIFKHNPHFIQELNEDTFVMPLVLNNPQANYCKQDTVEKAFHRYDKHMIEQICEVYGIENPELKCVINLTTKEKIFAEDFHNEILGNKNFLIIEPYSKDNYTLNRGYPFDKWQKIVNSLCKDIKIVQVGNTTHILKNVVDLTGETSFREAIALIERSDLFLAAESGLVHGATAVDTKSVVIITGYQDKKMVAYPQNINVDISSHGPCGLKIECELCKKDAIEHDWKELTSIIRKEICL